MIETLDSHDEPSKPNIRISKRPKLQELVESHQSNILSKLPEEVTLTFPTQMNILANQQARNLVAREGLTERTKKFAYKDPLTKLDNRRALTENLDRIIARLEREGGSFQFIEWDIDNFKRYNTIFTHDGGDKVTKLMAKLHSRKDEPIARIGGEEFTQVVFGNGESNENHNKATKESLENRRVATVMKRHMMTLDMLSRQLIPTLTQRKDLTEEEKADIPDVTTISFGAVKWEAGMTRDQIMKLASEAMLFAKDQGRNRGYRAKEIDGRIEYQEIPLNQNGDFQNNTND